MLNHSQIVKLFLLITLSALAAAADDFSQRKCSTLPQVQNRLNAVIGECQNQVKEDMIRQALQQIRYSELQHQQLMPSMPPEQIAISPEVVGTSSSSSRRSDRFSGHWMANRFRRDLNDASFYGHPTTMSKDDKEIAGCLMKCFFKKANALDFFGYPTLDGLVNLYTENVSDHQYFMAVLKITNFCLKGVNIKYKISNPSGNALTDSCNVAFDTFDCISDQIMDYCSGSTMAPIPTTAAPQRRFWGGW